VLATRVMERDTTFCRMKTSESQRRVLVTGATSGIGLATVLELGQRGWQVIATARTTQKAESLKKLCIDKGVDVDVIVVDFTSDEAISAVLSGLDELNAQPLDALVNNAGFAVPGAVEDVTPELAREQFHVNVFAPMFLIQALTPSMRAAGGGRIIQISSVSGRITYPMLGWYSASKHALESLSDALRIEVRPANILVSLIEPASFGTGIWSRAGEMLTEKMKSGPYAKVYQRADRMLSAKHPEPTPVATLIAKVLEEEKPKARYLIGAGSKSIPVLRHLPTATTDFLFGVGVGLRRVSKPVRRILRLVGA
jgi:NAD(P)-dependent dehydrogenase (short-subunit alcohol dehydrogenase family)